MRKKQWLCSLLAAGMCISMLNGCGKAEEEKVPAATVAAVEKETEATEATETEAEKAGSEAGTKHTVIDHAGNEVEIPSDIEKILFTSITPLPSVFPLVEGSADRVIGMSNSSMASAKSSMLVELFPEITDARTDFMSGSEINVEEIITMEPDIIFYKSQNTEEYEKLKETGIPAVGFSTNAQGINALDTYESWVTLLGDVLQKETKAAELVDYGWEVYDMIQKRLEDAGDDLEKPSILFLYAYSDGTMQTSGAKHWGEFWATAAGGINVAGDMDVKNPDINMEQIYQWDPDMIFVTNFVPYLVEDFTNNTIEGDDWSVVRAVQEGNIYKNPQGMYRWYPPSSDSPLMLLWMAKQVHPELFDDIDIEAETRDYYERFYGVELTDAHIEKIFHPTREASGKN